MASQLHAPSHPSPRATNPTTLVAAACTQVRPLLRTTSSCRLGRAAFPSALAPCAPVLCVQPNDSERDSRAASRASVGLLPGSLVASVHSHISTHPIVCPRTRHRVGHRPPVRPGMMHLLWRSLHSAVAWQLGRRRGLSAPPRGLGRRTCAPHRRDGKMGEGGARHRVPSASPDAAPDAAHAAAPSSRHRQCRGAATRGRRAFACSASSGA